MSWLTHPVVLLTVGGAVGTNARYGLGYFVKWLHPALFFPLGTLIINVSGSLLLAIIAVLCRDQMRNPTHHQLFLLLGVGFCGGYTTFSTFALETVNLIRHHHIGWAILNIAASVVASVLVVAWVISAGESN